jgi:hypothetical protein
MKIDNPPERIIREAAFAKRLGQICDNHPHVPPLHHGRLTWVKRELEKFDVPVSTETVRKWFSGEARPRRDKLKILAEIVRADEIYLSLGVVPEMDTGQQRKYQRALGGSVYLVAGMLEIAGYPVAFPEEGDPRADEVDLYAIINGVQKALKVTMVRDLGDWKFKLAVPLKHAAVTNIGIIRTSPVRFDVLVVPSELIDLHGDAKGGTHVEVLLNREDNVYLIGDTPVPVVRDFGKI